MNPFLKGHGESRYSQKERETQIYRIGVRRKRGWFPEVPEVLKAANRFLDVREAPWPSNNNPRNSQAGIPKTVGVSPTSSTGQIKNPCDEALGPAKLKVTLFSAFKGSWTQKQFRESRTQVDWPDFLFTTKRSKPQTVTIVPAAADLVPAAPGLGLPADLNLPQQLPAHRAIQIIASLISSAQTRQRHKGKKQEALWTSPPSSVLALICEVVKKTRARASYPKSRKYTWRSRYSTRRRKAKEADKDADKGEAAAPANGTQGVYANLVIGRLSFCLFNWVP